MSAVEGARENLNLGILSEGANGKGLGDKVRGFDVGLGREGDASKSVKGLDELLEMAGSISDLSDPRGANANASLLILNMLSAEPLAKDELSPMIKGLA